MRKVIINVSCFIVIAGIETAFSQGNDKLSETLAQSPELAWKESLPAPVFSSPVIDHHTIYFGCLDSTFYALDLLTGKLFWTYKTGEIVHSTAAIDANSLYIGSFDGYLYALSIINGSLIWKFKTVGHRYFPKGEVQGSPVVSHGLVIVGARDYNVYALDGTNGYCHWNKAFTKGWVLANAVNDSYRDDIYSIIKSNEQFLEVEIELGGIFSTPALASGFLVLTSTEGAVYCLK